MTSSLLKRCREAYEQVTSFGSQDNPIVIEDNEQQIEGSANDVASNDKQSDQGTP